MMERDISIPMTYREEFVMLQDQMETYCKKIFMTEQDVYCVRQTAQILELSTLTIMQGTEYISAPQEAPHRSLSMMHRGISSA